MRFFNLFVVRIVLGKIISVTIEQKLASIFTLGTNLKGVLWETIAVPELRVQCQELSKVLLQACEKNK